MPRIHRVFLLLLLPGLAACAASETVVENVARAPEPVGALPAVPARDGALSIRLAWPTPEALRPNADSTFLFGTTGTGAARLTINGWRVPVAPNGAFLAYLPVPADGRYHMTARAHRRTASETFAYRTPAPPGPEAQPLPRPAPTPKAPITTPVTGRVTGGKDTLATGSEIASGAPAPGADRRWFFPRGARLAVIGRRGDELEVRLGEGTTAWVSESEVTLTAEPVPGQEAVGSIRAEAHPAYLDVRLPVGYAPFLVEPGRRSLAVTLYDRTPPAESLPAADLVAGWSWERAQGAAVLRIRLADWLWGFKAFYEEDGALVLRVRRPPPIEASVPLQGLRVLVDAGHPPLGAIGPTGLTEAEANLGVALRLAEMLRGRGAEVVMTRTSEAPLKSASSVAAELWARVDLAVASEADLLVSLHNNAFPDGVNPFLRHGTETYYFHPFSAPLAEALLAEIAAVTGIPNLGAKQRSLALVRPTWMPAVLTESLFMMFPQQEAALQDAGFIERLAAAHLRGIEAFARSRATPPGEEVR